MDVGSSATKRPLLDSDPNYNDVHITKVKRRYLVEETGQEQAQQRVVEVVVRELDAALAQKENEALQLQERVHTYQRDLHLLRFGITSAFYLSSDASSTSGHNEEQNRVHPAALRVMGLSMPSGPKTRGVRYKSSTQVTSQEAVDEVPTDASATVSKESEQDEEKQQENDEEKNETAPTKVPRYVPPNMPKPPEVCASSTRMERHRIKRRLVVGNVSKWLPEDLRESAATHKWMLYLRGPKDSPDISDIIAKVRYFLHPSYQPHDIVDVVHPFYLARRGWGEFPVRVQVHFTLQGNRPIDIIHNLKLDRTYSGLQTLGGETVVDVWLKNESSRSVGDCSQEESRHQVDTLPECSDGSSDWHETVDHENQELMVATQLKREEQEEVGHKEWEEIKIKEENEEDGEEEEEDEEMEDEKEEEEDEEDAEEAIDKKGAIQEFQWDSKENINENLLNHTTSLLEHDLELIEVKTEADEIQNYADNTINVSVEEASKTYVASSEKGFVLHTLPDHDYLGSETFTLKCTLCVEQNNSDGIMVKNQLKAQMQVNSQVKEPSWSTSVPPPLVLIQKSQTFSQNSVIPNNHRQTLVKKEEIKEATKKDHVGSVPRNGVISNSSLVQCVDAEGNIFYISLQKPTFPAKCGIQKGILKSSLDGQVQHGEGNTMMNHVFSPSVEGKAVIKNNTVSKKKTVCSTEVASSASFQTGRSLLKKNCVASLSTSPSETKKSARSDKVTEPRPVILGFSWSRLKEVPEISDTRLMEAEQIVSRIADDRQAVIWILQQLPLADKRVNNREFRRQHPYCAKSVDEFLSWPVGKRHCAERLRANAAHAILHKSPSRFAKWSVRHIIKWSRLNALTPLPSLKKEHKEGENLPAINSSLMSTVTEPSEVQDWLESVAEASKTAKEMEIVNVDDLIPLSSDSKISCSSEGTSNAMMWVHSDTFFGEFLRDTTMQLDIKLKPEELCPGVMYPAAEELLNKACQSLCEDILRRSMCQAWDRCKGSKPNEIALVDVQNAVLSRTEFNIFTNDGLGVQAYDPFKYS